MIRISVIIGTRPEVIKMVSLIKAFEHCENVTLNICLTGQHRQMVLPLIDFFNIKIDVDLAIMRNNQSLADLNARALKLTDDYLASFHPDIVFVQGDTTTAMCAASAAFYRKIKIAHVEAGLRTYNIQSPFPEEFNRQVISRIADLHFAPTEAAKDNLIRENISQQNIHVTGNTVIDALMLTKDKLQLSSLHKNISAPYILITGHRRENFGSSFENICLSIKHLAEKYSHYRFIYPVHLNPNVQEPVKRILGNLENVLLYPPVDYMEFVKLMAGCRFILTDSGGIQEEAPSLHKPVLVMRDNTEREEAVLAGVAKLVGTHTEKIVAEASRLIEDEESYKRMTVAKSPFGDGNAAAKIAEVTLSYFKE